MLPFAQKFRFWVILSAAGPWPQLPSVLSRCMADRPRKEISVVFEDLQRILSSDELAAFGLLVQPLSESKGTPAPHALSEHFTESPTRELVPAA